VAQVDEVFSVRVGALRLAVIQRKISHGVQSARGALCRARLLTVTTSLRQQGRDVWEFLEQARRDKIKGVSPRWLSTTEGCGGAKQGRYGAWQGGSGAWSIQL